MIAKLMKLLSGVAALARRNQNLSKTSKDSVLDDMTILEEKYIHLRDTNVALIRERRELGKRLRQMESMSDAKHENAHTEELDKIKIILHDRHGLNVSRMHLALAVQDLSERFEAMGIVVRKLETETSAQEYVTQHFG